MDSDDEMVALLLEDEQAFDNDLREYLLIIAFLQDMLDAEVEKRKRPRRGGSRSGRRKSKPRQGMEGHAMPHNDYFVDDATHADNFRCQYRMSKGLFMNILHGVREFDPYFKLKLDAVGVVGFSSIQKCTAACDGKAHVRWEPQEEGVMRTAASFPSVRNRGYRTSRSQEAR
jgi:hypothetical protein